MAICMGCSADLHMAQLMPLPLTVSCFSKIQIGFTFLVPADPGSPGQRAIKQVCVRVIIMILAIQTVNLVQHQSAQKQDEANLKYNCSKAINLP